MEFIFLNPESYLRNCRKPSSRTNVPHLILHAIRLIACGAVRSRTKLKLFVLLSNCNN